MVLTQPLASADQVFNVTGEMRVGEFALAVAQPCEVEPKHRPPVFDEGARHMNSGRQVLAACEAMGKNRVRSRSVAEGKVETRGELFAAPVVEGDAPGFHAASVAHLVCLRGPG